MRLVQNYLILGSVPNYTNVKTNPKPYGNKCNKPVGTPGSLDREEWEQRNTEL